MKCSKIRASVTHNNAMLLKLEEGSDSDCSCLERSTGSERPWENFS